MYLVLIPHYMTEILVKECKSGKSTVLALGTVVMNFLSCTCMWTFSQLAVCYICMYVVYREQSVGSLHKHC